MLSSSVVRQASHHVWARPPGVRQSHGRLVGQSGVVGGVAVADGRRVAPVVEALPTIFGERQQEAEPTRPVGDDERLVDQPTEQLADLGGREVVVGAHLLGGVQA